MQTYIDASLILSEAKMLMADCGEASILVEGGSDITFFNVLMSKKNKVRFKSVNGWEKVYETILLAQKENYVSIAGVIDRDYHLIIEDKVYESNQLFFTDRNDIEMMLFFSQSLEKFLKICANKNKLKRQEDVRNPILSAAAYIGALRVVSLLNKYCLDFDGFECKNFVEKSKLDPDCKKMIEKITQRTRSKGKAVNVSDEELQIEVNKFLVEYDKECLCNGHDVLEILCIAMMKLYATSSADEYSSENMFNYLLMGYNEEEFQQSALYRKLHLWIKNNVEIA